MDCGCDERLLGYSLFLSRIESPDDIAASFATVDPIYQRAMQIRESATRPIAALGHGTEGREAIARLVRPTLRTYVPGIIRLGSSTLPGSTPEDVDARTLTVGTGLPLSSGVSGATELSSSFPLNIVIRSRMRAFRLHADFAKEAQMAMESMHARTLA